MYKKDYSPILNRDESEKGKDKERETEREGLLSPRIYHIEDEKRVKSGFRKIIVM